MDSIVEHFNSDSLIRLEVGSDQRAFYIQKVTLSSISSGFKHLIASIVATVGIPLNKDFAISLPQDDYQAWKVLLHWIAKRRLPENVADDELLLIRCWALGERYGIEDFQDEAILALLLWCDDFHLDTETIEFGLSLTRPGSKLRCLVAEELVFNIDAVAEPAAGLEAKGEGRIHLCCGSRSIDFIRDIINAERSCAACPGKYNRRFHRQAGERYGRWKSFMVGDGLMVHGRAAAWETELASQDDWL